MRIFITDSRILSPKNVPNSRNQSTTQHSQEPRDKQSSHFTAVLSTRTGRRDEQNRTLNEMNQKLIAAGFSEDFAIFICLSGNSHRIIDFPSSLRLFLLRKLNQLRLCLFASHSITPWTKRFVRFSARTAKLSFKQ